MENIDNIVQQMTDILSEGLNVDIKLLEDEKHKGTYNLYINDTKVKYKLPNDIEVDYTITLEMMVFINVEGIDFIIKDLKENTIL